MSLFFSFTGYVMIALYLVLFVWGAYRSGEERWAGLNLAVLVWLWTAFVFITGGR